MAIGLVASLVMSLSPPRGSDGAPLGKPTATPGRVGGLLPDITVAGRSHAIPLRTRRPVALALVPGDCHCAKLLDQLFHRVEQYQLPLDVALPSDVSSRTEQTVQDLGNGGTVTYTDPHGRLRDTYHASGVTVILVNSHGVVTQVRRDLDTGSLRTLDAARLGAGSG